MKHSRFLLLAVLAVSGCQEESIPGLVPVGDQTTTKTAVNEENPFPGRRNIRIAGPGISQKRPGIERTITGAKIEMDDQRAEVIGICRYDETDVGCWSPNGSPNPALAKQVIAKLEEMAAAPHRHGQIPWNIDKINRIVVTETSAHGSKPGPFAIEGLEGGRATSSISLDPRRQGIVKPPYINRSAQFFWVDKGVKTFSVIASRALNPAPGIALDFKAGASGSAGSATVKILTLNIAEPAPNTGANSSTLRQVRMTLEITGFKENWNINLMLKTKPQTQVHISKSWMMPMLQLVDRKGNVFTAEGLIDPADVTGLNLSFYELHRYRLGGLPLKP